MECLKTKIENLLVKITDQARYEWDSHLAEDIAIDRCVDNILNLFQESDEPNEQEIKEAVFAYNNLQDKTMLRWPIPENATENRAFYEGIMWALNYKDQ